MQHHSMMSTPTQLQTTDLEAKISFVLPFVETGGRHCPLMTLTSVQLGNIVERALLRWHCGLDPTENIRFGLVEACQRKLCELDSSVSNVFVSTDMCGGYQGTCQHPAKALI
jgi:hypothetical protein